MLFYYHPIVYIFSSLYVKNSAYKYIDKPVTADFLFCGFVDQGINTHNFVLYQYLNNNVTNSLLLYDIGSRAFLTHYDLVE